MKQRMVVWFVALACVAGGTALAADKKSEKLYKSKCSSCHGKDGKGATEKGQKLGIGDMTTAEFQKPSDEDFKKAISEGFKREKNGKKQEMDPYKEELSEAEIDGLVKFIREFKK